MVPYAIIRPHNQSSNYSPIVNGLGVRWVSSITNKPSSCFSVNSSTFSVKQKIIVMICIFRAENETKLLIMMSITNHLIKGRICRERVVEVEVEVGPEREVGREIDRSRGRERSRDEIDRDRLLSGNVMSPSWKTYCVRISRPPCLVTSTMPSMFFHTFD